MCEKNMLMCGLLLAFMISSVAMAAGNSVNDTFDSLANSKGGSNKAAGLDAFDDLAREKGGSDAGIGHGVDVGLQSIEANRAQKKTKEAEMRRARMEQEAKSQDEYAASNCNCPHGERDDGSCDSLLKIICDGRCPSVGENQRRANAAAKAEKHRICDAWKAQGPKANSAAFKAQLNQVYANIRDLKSQFDEESKKLDAMIRADEKRAQAQADRNAKATIKAEKDAENANRAARVAAEKAAEAKREAELKEWCMTGDNMDDCACSKWAPKKGPACRK